MSRSVVLYVPRHVQPSWSYTAGLFYLAVPREALVPVGGSFARQR